MKKIYFIIIILISTYGCSPSTENENKQAIDSTSRTLNEIEPIKTLHDTTPRIIEQMPKFKNGGSDLHNYLINNFEYPQTVKNDSIQGIVYVEVIIDIDGSVTSPLLHSSLHPDIDNECIRVLTSMPKWTPGRQRGEHAKVLSVIPFTIKNGKLEII
jgi:periplasmic protein TonB